MTGATLWEPTAERRGRANITRYIDWLAATRGLRFDSYDELWRWSVRDLDGFWGSIWEFFDVSGRRGDTVLADRAMPGARWFPGAEVNYAAQALRRRDDHTAIVAWDENGARETMSYAELARQVGAAAAGLRRLGVSRGDRVVGYLPTAAQTVVAFLATASLGATWSACSPEHGARSVIDRFRQIEPVVMVAVDGYRYNGRAHDRRNEVETIREQLPSLRATVLVPNLDRPQALPPGMLGWDELLAEAAEPEFESVPFEHPLWVLYSSGTTGMPKAIVHGHGGMVLEQLKALALHVDLGPDDRFFWYTTPSWMMWNFLTGGLLLGATVVLYDGSPGYPDLRTLWRLAEQAGVTYFGTSAPFISSCMNAGIVPAKEFDLSAVRGLGSTGAPLSPEGFRWVYQNVSPDVLLGSLSGGTDVCTAFIGPCPLLPVYAGELQCRALGAKVEAFDGRGEPVSGEVGELVLTEPMPCMPVAFWGDPDGSRYRASYFETYPGVWRHGDWIEISDRGGCVIHGRSDATLNRGGVRMGTAEFYRAVEELPEIEDCVVIDTGELGREGRLMLFVVLNEGSALDADLRARIGQTLRRELSPRHVPDDIFAVPDIPRTLTGKKVEVPLKRILRGEPAERVLTAGALSNPDSVKVFETLTSNSSASQQK
jgi:acetoacetyl-CoA synthetase